MISAGKLETLIQGLRDYLETLFPQIEVYCGFRREPDYREWKTPALSVGLNGVKTTPIGFEDYLGSVQNGLTYGECFGPQAELTMSFTLFFSMGETEEFANGFFMDLVNGLLFWQEAEFYELSCKPVAFSEHSQCFVLEAEGKVKRILTRTEESVLLTGVKVTAIPEKEEME